MPWTVTIRRRNATFPLPPGTREVLAVYKKGGINDELVIRKAFDPDNATERAAFIADATAEAAQWVLDSNDDKADAQALDSDLTSAFP